MNEEVPTGAAPVVCPDWVARTLVLLHRVIPNVTRYQTDEVLAGLDTLALLDLGLSRGVSARATAAWIAAYPGEYYKGLVTGFIGRPDESPEQFLEHTPGVQATLPGVK